MVHKPQNAKENRSFWIKYLFPYPCRLSTYDLSFSTLKNINKMCELYIHYMYWGPNMVNGNVYVKRFYLETPVDGPSSWRNPDMWEGRVIKEVVMMWVDLLAAIPRIFVHHNNNYCNKSSSCFCVIQGCGLLWLRSICNTVVGSVSITSRGNNITWWISQRS